MSLTAAPSREPSLAGLLGPINLLTAEQERDLARRIAGGRARDPETGQAVGPISPDGLAARSALIERNVPLAVRVAAAHARRWPSRRPDLESLAVTGLVVAADRFDPARGARFSTFASWWIRQEITRGVPDEFFVVRVPVHLYQSLGKDGKAGKPHLADAGRAALAAASASGAGLDDLAAPGGEVGPVDPLDRAAVLARVREAVGRLPAREAEVVRRRYLGDDPAPTPAEVGRAMRLSRRAVRDLEHAGLARLREILGGDDDDRRGDAA